MQTDEFAIATNSAALAHRGWLALRLDAATAATLEHDVPGVLDAAGLCDGPGMTAAALQSSPALRAFIDQETLRDLLEADLGLTSPLLSRCDAIRGPLGWQRSFRRIRRSAPGRRFRPGVDILLPTTAQSGAVTIIECGHLLPAEFEPADDVLAVHELPFGNGEGVILEAGTPWRVQRPQDIVRLTVVCGWIKPDCLHSAALGPEVLSTMGPRARALCGEHVGFPTSTEDFLAIERAALTGSQGRAKGSGI